jgi:8-oxo-dGTP diphosphatase
MLSVTAAILFDAGKVLIAQRNDNDKLAGKWEFPGGKIEHAETPEQCLIREMREEFGIEVDVIGFFGESVHHYETERIKLLAYYIAWKSGKIRLNAHAAIKWVSLNDLQEYDFAPADVPIVKKLIF